MALFNKLLNLHSDERNATEDFFTEIFTSLARADDQLLATWLKVCGISGLEGRKAFIETQRNFGKLPHHPTDSRIDMVVYMEPPTDAQGELPDLIFIESKVSSSEGCCGSTQEAEPETNAEHTQLGRYYDHLQVQSGYRQKCLVYVTKNYDPKSAGNFSRVKFIQTRWHCFYQLLRKRSQNPLAMEALRFMEAHQMSQGNRFSPVHLLAMRNIHSATSLMRQALDGKVADAFQALAQCIKRPKPGWEGEGRYALDAYSPDRQIKFQAGFMPPVDSDAIGDYPMIYASLGIKAKHPSQQTLRSAMKATCANGASWKSWALDGGEAEFGIWLETSLASFLKEEDHVDTIEKYFLTMLGQIRNWLAGQSSMAAQKP